MSSVVELALCSALRAGVLSFASPKESSQRKGDPWVGAGYAGPLRYSALAGAAELGAAPLRQSSPFFRQRLRCSAPLKGPGKPSGLGRHFFDFGPFFGSTVGAAFVSKVVATGSVDGVSIRDAFRVPLRGAEQRRRAGGSRRGLFEGRSPEFRSRPACRVAQGTGRSPAPTWGSPSFCLLFLGEARKSETPSRRKARVDQTPMPARVTAHPPTRKGAFT
jgi:hypothetical protein